MKKTVPEERPVVGKDLDNLRQVLGISTSDACWLFGLSMQKWGEFVHKKSHLPVDDPSLALLVRLIDNNPSLCEIPKNPDPESFYNLLNIYMKVDQKTFSLILGCDKSSGHRWISQNSRVSPHVMRLMHYLRKSILVSGDGVDFIENWKSVVTKESEARDICDIWKEGRWNQKKKN